MWYDKYVTYRDASCSFSWLWWGWEFVSPLWKERRTLLKLYYHRKTVCKMLLFLLTLSKGSKTLNALSPTEGVWSSSVVQRAAARQIQLVDLSAGSYQGDRALAVPVSCSIVQSSSARHNRRTAVKSGNTKVKFLAPAFVNAYRPKWSFTSSSAALFNSKFRQSTLLSRKNKKRDRKQKVSSFNKWDHTWSRTTDK